MAATVTHTVTTKKIKVNGAPDQLWEIHKLACVAHTDGSLSVAATYPILGQLMQVVVDPGSPAPDANYDLVLTHPTHGHDVMGAALTNLAAAVTAVYQPKDAGGTIMQSGIFLEGIILTVTVAEQTANGAKWDLYLYVRKSPSA